MRGIKLTDALRQNDLLCPDRTATIMDGRRMSWQSHLDRVRRLAAGYRRAGAKRGDRIAILALNSDRYIEAIYSILWAGCVAVPLNTRWAHPELAHALDDCNPKIILFDSHFSTMTDALADGERRAIAIDDRADYVVPTFEQLIEECEPCDDAAGSHDDLAMIFYTGGTTGRSKGVMLSHSNLSSNFHAMNTLVDYSAATVFLHVAPMFHVADACCLVGMTSLGFTHVVAPRFEPEEIIRLVAHEGVTATMLVPTMMARIVETSRWAHRPVSELRHVLYGASPISEALLRQAMEVFPNARLCQAYGQTEASPVITLLSHEDHLRGLLRAAGRPIPSVDVRIVDKKMHDVPPGAVGEIMMQGPGIMLGYWRQPELTSATIVDGWLRTGDGGYRDADGYLFVVDRIKDMIVTGGENVYSSEVENALMEHPAVLQCAVIGVPSEAWGESVHAFVQINGRDPTTAEQLANHMSLLIAKYKCPKSFTVQTEPLPMSEAGKILKTALRLRTY